MTTAVTQSEWSGSHVAQESCAPPLQWHQCYIGIVYSLLKMLSCQSVRGDDEREVSRNTHFGCCKRV